MHVSVHEGQLNSIPHRGLQDATSEAMQVEIAMVTRTSVVSVGRSRRSGIPIQNHVSVGYQLSAASLFFRDAAINI